MFCLVFLLLRKARQSSPSDGSTSWFVNFRSGAKVIHARSKRASNFEFGSCPRAGGVQSDPHDGEQGSQQPPPQPPCCSPRTAVLFVAFSAGFSTFRELSHTVFFV